MSHCHENWWCNSNLASTTGLQLFSDYNLIRSILEIKNSSAQSILAVSATSHFNFNLGLGKIIRLNLPKDQFVLYISWNSYLATLFGEIKQKKYFWSFLNLAAIFFHFIPPSLGEKCKFLHLEVGIFSRNNWRSV